MNTNNQNALNSVITDAEIKTWSGRTQEEINKGAVHVLDFKKQNGSLVTDQEAIQAAVNHCLNNSLTLSWDGANLVSTNNIENFWEVTHTGKGSITRGGDIFYIVPTENDINTQYVKAGGSTKNDGIGINQAIAFISIPSRLKKIGAKSVLGQWRFKLSGKIETNGIRLNDIPTFNKPVQFFGDEVSSGEEPTTTVQGLPTNNNVYAFLSQNSSNFLNLEFKNIKFSQWQGANPNKPASNCGGVVIWNPCHIVVENCIFNKTSIGVSIRQGYLKVIKSKFVDNITFGVNAMYNATANIGNLSGGGNIFNRSSVVTGRSSIMYIQGNIFDECAQPVQCTRVSRIRTQANTFKLWTGAAISCDLNSTYTPDNFAGNPDIIEMTPTLDNPFYKSSGLSAHLHLHKQGGIHNYSASTLVVENSANTAVYLGALSNDYVPFRMPKYTLYGKVRMTLKLWVFIPKGVSGKLTLNAQGASLTAELIPFNWPMQTEDKYVEITMTYMTRDDKTGFYNVACPQLNLNRGGSVNLTASMRSPSEENLIWRLYLTTNSDLPITFRGIQSEVNI
ncbi:hypothetical protein [Acinetobacter rudis]|uniref:hypothetical protein n=1 Tax=Acinetobacter rudis TaxID=632955 RepID=UPI003340B7C6